jgi:two-component system KDP operon response regulator KdpE
MSAPPPAILVVEDETPMRRFLRTALTAQDYRVIEAASGKEALAVATTHNPDVILLDLGLPDIDGIELTRQVREWSRVPVIVISARGREADKVAALDAGADDYLTKPFAVGELLARIRVALRHAAKGAEGAVFRAGALTIDIERRRVEVDGKEVHLTPIEWKILATLAKHADRVVTHRHLLQEVWGPRSTEQTHYLRVFMTHLRRKIEPDPVRPRYLQTEPGVGYRLKCDA